MNSDIAIAQKVVDDYVNPLIAAHGGKVTIEDIVDGKAHISMQGGCQGCAMAKRTMNDFVLRVLKHYIPCITGVQDVTDHSAGANPYFKKDV